MYNSIGKNIAFIPLRGGSKSIPLKNIKEINGRPLVFWVLDAADKCHFIDKIVVSTDNDVIKKTVQSYSSEKIICIDRTEAVSTDDATTESAMLEFAEKFNFENIMLIQATSPLLNVKDLENGFKHFNRENVDSVLSVVRQKRFLWSKSTTFSTPSNYDPLNRPRRQDFEGFFVENGALYLTTRKNLLSSKCRVSGNIATIEMPEETYYELDELSDWKIIEQLLKNRKSDHDLAEKIKKIKCVISDCDGVLTDGGMYYSDKGDELKKFNTKDGMGFKILKEKGYITGIITGEDIQLVRKRAEKLKVDFVYLGVENKMSVINQICQKYRLSFEEIAYIGDDINDLDVIENVGFGCSVSDGVELVKKKSDYVTQAKGGAGAFRELVSLIDTARYEVAISEKNTNTVKQKDL